MKRNIKKLNVHKETLRNLASDEIERVAGGRAPLTPNPFTSWLLPCITWNCGTAYGCVG